jgi:deoxyribodipyrimidine photolyase
MTPSSATPRILVIRAWTEPLAQLRAALRDAGVTVRITRVDIEPALNAALARSSYEVVVWDPRCSIARDIVETRLREHGRSATIVVLEELGVTVTNIVHTLTARFN